MADTRLSPVEALAGQVAALARRLDGLEEDRTSDGALVRAMASRMGVQTEAPDADEPGHVRDAPVPCPKCGAKVGYYDQDTDLVRARHREHLVYMRMGPGGSIVIVCRRCSHPVEVTYVTPDDAATAEVRDGLLVMDVAMLTDLLTRALAGGSGQVTLRLVESPAR